MSVRKGRREVVIEEEHGYPTDWLQGIDRLLELYRRPGRVVGNNLICCFFPIEEEKQHTLWWLRIYLVKFPSYLLLALLMIPLQFLCFVCGSVLEKLFRKHYIISLSRDEDSRLWTPPEEKEPKQFYSFCTSNLCLLPEYMSRFNLLHHLENRLERIGDTFVSSQEKYGETSRRDLDKEEIYWKKRKDECPQIVPHSNDRCKVHDACPSFDVSISTELPPVDFLLLQEACWMKEVSEKLKNKLHKHYPYIVYDAGCNGLQYNVFFSGSAVMLASKYPLLQVEFKPFEDSVGQDLVASKGLLMAKVLLGKTKSNKKMVGFVATTHLQAHQGTNTTVHPSQLDSVAKWSAEFRRRWTHTKDAVAFDVVGGDFNLDNMSPLDQGVWAHPLFTEHYKDLGRNKPGRDYDWAVGTEMRHLPINDSQISTPQGLKDVLEDDLLRQYYFLSPDLKESGINMGKKMTRIDIDGNIIQQDNGGKRRIDFLLFSPQDNPTPVCFNPVTALRNLTDHVPYCLTLQTNTKTML